MLKFFRLPGGVRLKSKVTSEACRGIPKEKPRTSTGEEKSGALRGLHLRGTGRAGQKLERGHSLDRARARNNPRIMEVALDFNPAYSTPSCQNQKRCTYPPQLPRGSYSIYRKSYLSDGEGGKLLLFQFQKSF